jgi:hypothetical protein
MKKYRFYIKQVMDRNNKMSFGLTLTEIKQTVRYLYKREVTERFRYGWE